MTVLVSAWAATYLIHSTLLIAAVWLASRWVRSVPARDVLWKIALTGSLVTASLQVAVPVERLLPASAPQRMTVTVSAASAAYTRKTAVAERVLPSAERPVLAPEGAPDSGPLFGMQTLLQFVWLGGALLLVARLLLGRNRLLADLADRREVVLGNDRALLDTLCRAAGCARLVRLTESSVVRSPMAMLGWEIVVPKRIFARLSDEQRRTILAHELAHLTRRDPLWLAAAEAVNALLFIQPLNRVARTKMKETAEFLCDDAAVAQTGDRQALAETLAELAAHVVPMPTSVAAMAEGGSNLIVRVTRVLRAQRGPDLPLKMRARLAIAVLPLLALAMFAPGVAPALSQRAGASVEAATRVATPSSERVAPRQVMAAAVAPATGSGVTKRVAAPAVALPRVAAAPAAPSAALTVVAAAPAETAQAAARRETAGVNFATEMKLTQTFETGNGFTRVALTARDVEFADDASSVRFTNSSGFMKVVETSERGPRREGDVTSGPDGEPVYRYRVRGADRPWDMDAQRLLASGWMAEKAYDRGTVASCSTKAIASDEHKGKAAGRETSHWNASVEYTGTRDGVPLLIRLRAVDFKYDTATGEPLLGARGWLRVEETVGNVSRVFTMNRDQTMYSGAFSRSGGTAPKEWLGRVLRERSEAPAVVIQALTR